MQVVAFRVRAISVLRVEVQHFQGGWVNWAGLKPSRVLGFQVESCMFVISRKKKKKKPWIYLNCSSANNTLVASSILTLSRALSKESSVLSLRKHDQHLKAQPPPKLGAQQNMKSPLSRHTTQLDNPISILKYKHLCECMHNQCSPTYIAKSAHRIQAYGLYQKLWAQAVPSEWYSQIAGNMQNRTRREQTGGIVWLPLL